MEQLIRKYQKLLATIQIFQSNVHGFHWNLICEHFFELHEELGALYDCLSDRADVVAEFIRVLDAHPEPRFSRYITSSVIEEAAPTTKRMTIIENVVKSLQELINVEKTVLSAAKAADDEAAVNMLGGFLEADGKKLWMWKSNIPLGEEY